MAKNYQLLFWRPPAKLKELNWGSIFQFGNEGYNLLS